MSEKVGQALGQGEQMETRELYEVLGLHPFADGAMVDQAYWHLAKSFQTQAVADPRARQALDELNEAYSVLGTPRLREEYDVMLSGRGAKAPARGVLANADADDAPRKGFGFLSFFKHKAPAEAAPSRSAQSISNATSEAVVVRATQDRPSARRSSSDVQDLQASTGEMLKRWRANAATEAATSPEDEQPVPDTTLVDIFRSEMAVEDEQDPLNAVMDVLRATKDAAPVGP